MHHLSRIGVAGCVLAALGSPASAQRGAPPDTALPQVKTLVARLDLDRYKATIKGLTQFGDRRQGTDRNRAAVDWIEAQLKSYGCTNTERIDYEYNGRQLQKRSSTNKVDLLARGRQSKRGGLVAAARAGGQRRRWGRWRRR